MTLINAPAQKVFPKYTFSAKMPTVTENAQCKKRIRILEFMPSPAEPGSVVGMHDDMDSINIYFDFL